MLLCAVPEGVYFRTVDSIFQNIRRFTGEILNERQVLKMKVKEEEFCNHF